MALQFDEKSSGTAEKSMTRSTIVFDDEKDWNPKLYDVEVTSRELEVGTAKSRLENRPDPVTD